MLRKFTFAAAVCSIAALASCGHKNAENADTAVIDSEVIAVATDTVTDTNGNVVEEGVVMDVQEGAAVDTNAKTLTGK